MRCNPLGAGRRIDFSPQLAIAVVQIDSEIRSGLTSKPELPKTSDRVLWWQIPGGGNLRAMTIDLGGINGIDRGQMTQTKGNDQGIAQEYEVGEPPLVGLIGET